MNTTSSSDYGTRGDALRYVRATLGELAELYDVDAITDDVRQQLGTWDFSRLASEDEPVESWAAIADEVCDQLSSEDATVDFWAIAKRHGHAPTEGPVPGCPDWCCHPDSHGYEHDDQDDNDKIRVGYHEGLFATVPDDNNATGRLDLCQKITRTPDGTTSHGPLTVILTIDNEQLTFTDPARLRGMIDALGRAARMIDRHPDE